MLHGDANVSVEPLGRVVAGADDIVFRGMTCAEVDAGYDNRAAVADSADWIVAWPGRSEPIRSRPDARLDLRFGNAPRATLDYFPCGAKDAPLFLFFHGGYWQRNNKEMFAFAAEGPLSAGINFASAGYTLAPEAQLSDMVAEARAALDYVAANAGELGHKPERIIVGGWSAGGHLAATLLDHPAVCGAMPISGIYDLTPIVHCSANELMRLSDDDIAALSPIKTLRAGTIPVCVAYGDRELPEFQRQAEDFAAACYGQAYRADALGVPGRHHFSILDELSSPSGLLTKALAKLAA